MNKQPLIILLTEMDKRLFIHISFTSLLEEEPENVVSVRIDQ